MGNTTRHVFPRCQPLIRGMAPLAHPGEYRRSDGNPYRLTSYENMVQVLWPRIFSRSEDVVLDRS